jgi:hypothetical protein
MQARHRSRRSGAGKGAGGTMHVVPLELKIRRAAACSLVWGMDGAIAVLAILLTRVRISIERALRSAPWFRPCLPARPWGFEGAFLRRGKRKVDGHWARQHHSLGRAGDPQNRGCGRDKGSRSAHGSGGLAALEGLAVGAGDAAP